MVLIDIINEFRAKYGKPSAITAEDIEHQHCKAHCLYMANNLKIEHTPDYFLCGKTEIVGTCSYKHNDEDTIRFLFYEKIANSPGHLQVLLESTYLAYYFYVNYYIGYLCIRGWK